MQKLKHNTSKNFRSATFLMVVLNTLQGSRGEAASMPLPAGASMWHANLPDISQRSVNAAAKAAALASVGDKLVDSLQAQSLDLPPQAAKVTSRHSMRYRSPLFECVTGLGQHQAVCVMYNFKLCRACTFHLIQRRLVLFAVASKDAQAGSSADSSGSW